MSYLDSDETTLLKWEVELGGLTAAKDVRAWIEACFVVRYTMTGVYILVKR